jgi:YbgC/YbaW family acyl-CoA thioester hydrolase
VIYEPLLNAKILGHFLGKENKMSNPVFEYDMTILEHHLDTFGHVNNATYLEIYEEARWDFITKNGLGLKEILQTKIGPVVLDLSLTFKAELLNREQIKIVSQARTEMRNKYVMVLDQKILKLNGKVASTLQISVGLMDLKERKLISPTKEWMEALGVMEFTE